GRRSRETRARNQCGHRRVSQGRQHADHLAQRGRPRAVRREGSQGQRPPPRRRSDQRMDQRRSSLVDADPPRPALADSPRLSRYSIVLMGVFASYVVLAQAGFALAGQASLTLPFRPTSGLSLAVLIVFGLSAWPAVFAASLTVALGVTHNPLSSIIAATGYTLGAVAGA